MSNIFSETEVLKMPRSLQKFYWNIISSMDYGKLYPMFVMDCVPGDTIRINGSLNIRAKPMINPNLTPNKLTMHFFFVPYRLLDENFQQGITGTTEQGTAVSYDFPKWTVTPTSTKSKTLWDYMGLPINVKWNNSGAILEEDNTNVKGVEPTAYLKRAYNKIYNDMYRNENYEEEIDLDSESIQYRCWRADYFTKALPWQQKPSDANYFALPVSTQIGGNIVSTLSTPWDEATGSNVYTPLKAGVWHSGDNRHGLDNYPIMFIKNAGETSYTNQTPNILGTFNLPAGSFNLQTDDYDSNNKLQTTTQFNVVPRIYPEDDLKLYEWTINNTNNLDALSTSFDVSDLRLAVQMQKWAERNARGGTRYDEFIRAHFGITPRDARLQLPEFIGGFKFPILCGENYSTTETSNAPQGTRAGIGNGIGADKIRKYFVEEYGLIMGIASILPQAYYQQGMPREWIKHTQLDFYHHELCCLSEREVYQGELVCSNSTNDTTANTVNTTNFGFTGIYNEYRYHPNVITGEARLGEYGNWHQSRILDAGNTEIDGVITPKTNLGADFVKCTSDNVRKSPFASIDNMTDPFIVQGNFSVKAFRPMTYKAEPGLIDHF